ncbi:MAG: dCTP deaminase [Planctomycetota bacterium]|nr:dCTP deaminase [Planctomycetota bacterium]
MILARQDVLRAMSTGELKVEPFDESLLGAASLDLRLSPYFRRLHRSDRPIDLIQEIDYRDPDISEVVKIAEGAAYDLKSGETVLGLTTETISFTGALCGRLEGRSRFARLGLLIHISAGFMAPGTSNQQVLEISNMSPRTLRLFPGTAICQLIFERMESATEHQGRYRRQSVADFIASPDAT